MTRLTPKQLLIKLHKNLNTLQQREARYGGNAPLDLLNQIADHQAAIDLTEQTLNGEMTQAELDEALKPLLIEINQRTGEAAISLTLGDVGGSIIDSMIAGRDIIIHNYQAPAPIDTAEQPATAEPIPDNPYRGLFAFRPEHADLFFGRQTFINQLIQAVENQPLVAVLGASGSGKSSVVFAGVVPELTTRPGEPWLFSTFRPGDDPFQNLAAALVPLYEETESKTALLGVTRDLAQSLRQQRYPLSDVLGLIRVAHPDHRLLLIADQFEELYTLCRDTDTRQTFLDLLLSALPAESTIDHSLFTIILTLRADFLGQASLYRPFADALQGHTKLLGPMTEDELREAIERPAKVRKVKFEEGLWPM